MIEVSSKKYDEIATKVIEAIGDSEWFCGSVFFEIEGLDARLYITIITYRNTETRRITDIVPVWWSFECPPLTSDFSFLDLKTKILEQQK